MQSYAYKDTFFKFLQQSQYYLNLQNSSTIFQEQKENQNESFNNQETKDVFS